MGVAPTQDMRAWDKSWLHFTRIRFPNGAVSRVLGGASFRQAHFAFHARAIKGAFNRGHSCFFATVRLELVFRRVS